MKKDFWIEYMVANCDKKNKMLDELKSNFIPFIQGDEDDIEIKWNMLKILLQGYFDDIGGVKNE